ncbi:MAG: hypothetical protein D4R64_13645 [Porphyromonadaceae bacterium]|nr:MAG: hypothetical protein D4R64_13645 [Porphyromonadaceae bacterium]
MVTGLTAQNEQDVLRYSFIQTGGTTRSLSLGGALGAVGGDFAALSINPAGLGIYRTGEFSITGDYNYFTADARYLGNTMKDNGFKMGFSHFGVVVPINIEKEGSGIKGVTLAVGYNKLKDYGQNMTMKGINNSNSLVDGFVNTANSTNGSWDPFTDGLAWETYLIDYDSIAGVYYSDFGGSQYGQTQRRTVSTKGSLGEYDFSLGVNLSDKLFFGATMGVQKANYTEVWEHSETDPNDVINFFNGFSFRNTLTTSGSGVNFKLGLLAKPMEFLRIGASIQTPTVLNLKDDFSSSMSTDLNDDQPTHKYDASGQFDYSVTTPFKATGSLAFIFKQYGLISVDYEYVDYTSGRLRASDYDFFSENEAVSQRYKAASNLRVGAEVRLMNSYYVRGGYALYTSPYEVNEPNAGKNLNTFSAGAGYRDQYYFIDFGFARSAWDQTYFLYGNNSADVTNSQTRFSATLGVKF